MKNTLLVTLTISSILLSTNVYAKNYNFSYDGNNYGLDGKEFKSFVDLGKYFQSQNYRFDLKNDRINMPREQEKKLINDFFSKESVRNDYIKLLFPNTPEIAAKVSIILNNFDKLFSIISDDDRNRILSEIDINILHQKPELLYKNILISLNEIRNKQNAEDQDHYSRMKELETKLELEVKNLQNPKGLSNVYDIVDDEPNYSNINDEIVMNSLQKLYAIITINQGEELSPFVQTNINHIKEKIINNVNFSTVRNKTHVQEILKNMQKYFARTINLEDRSTKEYFLPILNEIKGLFLATDIKDATAVPTVQKSDSAISESMLNSLMISREIVDSRINSFSAIAAGDFMNTKGMWIQGSYTSGKQKAYGNAPGYKISQQGITIGADAGDDYMLGLAYSSYINDINDKANSKLDLSSHITTIYGKFNVSNEVFIKGQGQIGKAYIKKERKTGDLAKNTAQAKTDAAILSGKIEFGYDAIVIEDMHLVPTVGVSYLKVEVKAYDETGDGLNRAVDKRTSNKIASLLGMRVVYNTEVNSDIKLLPEIHANLDYAFKTKNSATIVTIIKGIDPIATPSEKLAKAYYNIGMGLKAIYKNNFELAFDYDLGLAKKFQSHTGALKLRVNM